MIIISVISSVLPIHYTLCDVRLLTSADEVTDFRSKLRRERGDDIVIFCLLGRNALHCELSLDLGKPDLRIRGPEEREFEVDCRYSACLRFDSHVMMR